MGFFSCKLFELGNEHHYNLFNLTLIQIGCFALVLCLSGLESSLGNAVFSDSYATPVILSVVADLVTVVLKTKTDTFYLSYRLNFK